MNPGNDHPEIPSFKPVTGKEEEKKGTGIVPSSAKPAPSSGFKFPGFGGGSTGASKAFSSPNLKVRGLGGGGSTVMDRLKNLRKKDLIFIAAGLCTLGMAPLAEHLLMSPDEQTAKLQEGFNSQQGPLFQDGSSVYEPGNGVGSPGGLVGSGGDVITPLNVRDPSNLIMSPGASKKADAVVAPPPTTPVPTKDDSDWKNALSGAARTGASKAAQQAPRPRPNVGKMAGAIRGLSALGGGGGGTGASLKLDALSARGVPNSAAGSNALTRSQATPGYRGATSRSGSSSGAGEDLRAAGAKQSDIFNKGGGASAALDAASREAIPTGGAGTSGGRPGEGSETKNPGGNSQKDNKSLGESLAFLRQKMEMEKSLDLKWERKKWNEFGRQKMMEESALKLGFDMFGKFAEKAFIGPLGDAIGQAVAGGGDQIGWECTMVQGGGRQKFPASGPPNSTRQGSTFYDKNGQPVATGCSKVVLGGADTGAAPVPADRRGGQLAGVPGGQRTADELNRQRTATEQTNQAIDRERGILGSDIKAIAQTCAQTGTSKPPAAYCDMAKPMQSLDGVYAVLSKAAQDLLDARSEINTAHGALNTEIGAIRHASGKLAGAASKVQLGFNALVLTEGQEPKFAEAKTNATGAKAEFDSAAGMLGQAQDQIVPANAAITKANEKGEAAFKGITTAQSTVGQVVVPAEAAAGPLGQWTGPFSAMRTKLDTAKTTAGQRADVLRGDYDRWKETYNAGTQARELIHGAETAKTALPQAGSDGADTWANRQDALGRAAHAMSRYPASLTDAQKNLLETEGKKRYDADYKGQVERFGALKWAPPAAGATLPTPTYPLAATAGGAEVTLYDQTKKAEADKAFRAKGVETYNANIAGTSHTANVNANEVETIPLGERAKYSKAAVDSTDAAIRSAVEKINAMKGQGAPAAPATVVAADAPAVQ